MVRERSRNGMPGLPMLVLWFAAVVATIVLFISGVAAADRGEPLAVLMVGGAPTLQLRATAAAASPPLV